MLNIIVYWLQGINRHGYLFVVAHFYPVWFTQDMDMENKGYDILSLRYNKRGYFRGLIYNTYNK